MARSDRRERSSPRGEIPEIPLIGEVDDAAEDIVRDLLEIQPGGKGVLLIDSGGGSVYSAMGLCTLIRLRRLQLTAIVLGECSSASILVFAACRRRQVTRRSIFLFHKIRWSADKDIRTEDAVNWAEHCRWLEDEVDRYQAELFGIPAETLDPWIRNGRYVLGPELVELGIAELLEA